jgi:hypothetical protein
MELKLPWSHFLLLINFNVNIIYKPEKKINAEVKLSNYIIVICWGYK